MLNCKTWIWILIQGLQQCGSSADPDLKPWYLGYPVNSPGPKLTIRPLIADKAAVLPAPHVVYNLQGIAGNVVPIQGTELIP